MALNNCGFASTEDIDIKGTIPFEWTMDALMLGVGVGFDTKGAGKIIIKKPKKDDFLFRIPDSREGWVEALKYTLEAYFFEKTIPKLDYSLIRPAGELIRGFGGIASGPEPLEKMIENIKDLLNQRIGDKLRSIDIVDIMNFIGKCVVAGNVRRCIAEDQRLSTHRGLIMIKDIKIGDLILTSNGEYKKVMKKFDQGIQNIVKIKTTLGDIKCTKNHKCAVYDGLKSFKWKKAEELTSNDRLISLYHSKGLIELNTDYAWLIGLFIGDGCAHLKKDGYHGSVRFTMTKDRLNGDLGQKCISVLNNLGYNPSIQEQKNYGRVCVYSKDFVIKMQSYKLPSNEQIIPDLIWNGTPKLRGSFLAGLADADGGTRNDLVFSKYPNFLKKIQKIALSLGIATTLHIRPKRKIKGRNKLYEGSHSLKIRGISSQQRAKDLIEPFSTRWRVELRNKKKNGLSLPYQIILDAKKKGEINLNITASGLVRTSKTNQIGDVSTVIEHGSLVQKIIKKYRNANFDTLIEKNLVNPNWMPIEIIDIRPAGKAKTYDIEVERNHEFICEGFLVHNSAEIALGDINDTEFITMKQDKEKLTSHRWASNNSIFAKIGMDYSFVAEQIAKNGEPGVLWLENSRAYSRMAEPPDYKDKKVAGVNPCGEQSLESYELCCLVESFPSNHESYEEFQDTLKYAYLYAKSVTLLNTHWKQTNAIMGKNRRIGTSQSGIINAFIKHGRREIFKWCEKGYKYLKELDSKYSDWLTTPKSIKMTSIKPSGSVSLLPGVTPGIHYPHSEYYIRRIRFNENSDLLPFLREAGYEIHTDKYSPNTSVVEFPIHEEYFERAKKDVSMWEQLENAAAYQKYWADNQVSITVTFKEKEAKEIKVALEIFEDKLKGVTFLPLNEHGYEQAPYEEITQEQYHEMKSKLRPLNLSTVKSEALGERFCDADFCEIKFK